MNPGLALKSCQRSIRISKRRMGTGFDARHILVTGGTEARLESMLQVIPYLGPDCESLLSKTGISSKRRT